MSETAHLRIDAYLNGLRRRLRGMNDADVNEILRELRGHIDDRLPAGATATAAQVDAALSRLGNLDELATHYMTDYLAVRIRMSRAPVRMMQRLIHWVRATVLGFVALAASTAGYFLGGALVLCAALKSIHPRTAGLWTFADSAGDVVYSLRLGFGQPPPGARDLLGWLIVPVGLAAGYGLLMITTRFALWFTRQSLRSTRLFAA